MSLTHSKTTLLRGCRACSLVVAHNPGNGAARRHNCPHGVLCKRSRTRGGGDCDLCFWAMCEHRKVEALKYDPALRVAWSDRQLALPLSGPAVRRVSARAGRVAS